MERLDKKNVTLIAAILLSMICILGASLIWRHFWAETHRAMLRSEVAIKQAKVLLSKKKTMELEWDLKKGYLISGVSPDELLNTWLKELLEYAQTQSLQIDKIEPAGVRSGDQGKESMVFLSFQADINKLAKLLYHLLEADPMAKIESFSIRQEEDSKRLSVELMLGKAIV